MVHKRQQWPRSRVLLLTRLRRRTFVTVLIRRFFTNVIITNAFPTTAKKKMSVYNGMMTLFKGKLDFSRLPFRQSSSPSSNVELNDKFSLVRSTSNTPELFVKHNDWLLPSRAIGPESQMWKPSFLLNITCSNKVFALSPET